MKKSFKNNIARLIDFILDLLGLKYIWYKLNPHKRVGNKEPRTITLWLLSVFVALYSIASSRYEQELTRLEYRVSNLIMQVEGNNDVLSFIPQLQNRKIPYKPSILNPWSTIKSFFSKYDQPDPDLVQELQDLIVKQKYSIAKLDLTHINLKSSDLSYANFESSNLSYANLRKTLLLKANFHNAKIIASQLQEAYLQEADLSQANLYMSNFQNANLSEVNFKRSFLQESNLSGALLVGADTRDSDINLAKLKGAKYNSKIITFGELLNVEEIALACALNKPRKYELCKEEIKRIPISPTKFPPDFNPKEHDMIDVSEILEP